MIQHPPAWVCVECEGASMGVRAQAEAPREMLSWTETSSSDHWVLQLELSQRPARRLAPPDSPPELLVLLAGMLERAPPHLGCFEQRRLWHLPDLLC